MKAAFAAFKRAPKDWLKRGVRRAVRATAPQRSGISPAYFGLGQNEQGALTLASVELAELSHTWGSPLHVVNAARLRANARRFMSAAPACEVFFSYKTNPVPGVMKELHALGIGAEVISEYELWLALKLGVAPSKIVYNGPAKSAASIRRAVELDIALLNLNHREEIPVVAGIAAQMGRRARVGLRVSLSGWSGQFGTPAADGQAHAAFAEALESPHLDVIGLHVHRGGMMQSEEELSQFIDGVLDFAESLHERFGLNLGVLDFGGSLGSPSVRGLGSRELRFNRTFLRDLEPPNPSKSPSIEGYTRSLMERVSDHYRRQGRAMPRIFLEPGRALASDAQLLLTQVLSLKPQAETTFAILDAGINLAESCRGEYHEFLTTRAPRNKSTQSYTLVGPICTPGDTLRWAVTLPELRVGDTLAIMDAGAYFVPFSTAFSFPRPGIVLVDHDGKVTPLRRAETFDDLVGLDVSLDSDG